MLRRCLWEAVGTAALVYIGCGAMLSTDDGAAIALAFGVVVSLIVSTIGPRSGAHVNPAVTIGFAVDRQFPWREVPGYITAQMVGAFAGLLLLVAAFSTPTQLIQSNLAVAATSDTPVEDISRVDLVTHVRGVGLRTGTFAGGEKSVLDPQLPNADKPVTHPLRWIGAAVAELLHSALLMGVILTIVNDAKEEGGKCALVIGGTVLALCAAGGASQASMNPARTFWCNLFALRWDTLPLFIICPIAGAVAAAMISQALRTTQPASDVPADAFDPVPPATSSDDTNPAA